MDHSGLAGLHSNLKAPDRASRLLAGGPERSGATPDDPKRRACAPAEYASVTALAASWVMCLGRGSFVVEDETGLVLSTIRLPCAFHCVNGQSSVLAFGQERSSLLEGGV